LTIFKEDFFNIVNKIYITYSNQFGISWFTDKGERYDFIPGAPARDVIYVNEIRNEMIKSFTEGESEGETTYFKSIDKKWKIN
jgi:hypothetical protein